MAWPAKTRPGRRNTVGIPPTVSVDGGVHAQFMSTGAAPRSVEERKEEMLVTQHDVEELRWRRQELRAHVELAEEDLRHAASQAATRRLLAGLRARITRAAGVMENVGPVESSASEGSSGPSRKTSSSNYLLPARHSIPQRKLIEATEEVRAPIPQIPQANSKAEFEVAAACREYVDALRARLLDSEAECQRLHALKERLTEEVARAGPAKDDSGPPEARRRSANVIGVRASPAAAGSKSSCGSTHSAKGGGQVALASNARRSRIDLSASPSRSGCVAPAAGKTGMVASLEGVSAPRSPSNAGPTRSGYVVNSPSRTGGPYRVGGAGRGGGACGGSNSSSAAAPPGARTPTRPVAAPVTPVKRGGSSSPQMVLADSSASHTAMETGKSAPRSPRRLTAQTPPCGYGAVGANHAQAVRRTPAAAKWWLEDKESVCVTGAPVTPPRPSVSPLHASKPAAAMNSNMLRTRLAGATSDAAIALMGT